MPKPVWAIELAGPAKTDLAGILDWTSEHFGARQAHKYEQGIRALLRALAADPQAAPSRPRDDDIGTGYRTIRMRRPGRHLILYRVGVDHVLVLRVLHDGMEITRHLPPEE